MYIYLFFIILGILLYILLNNYNTFSIGIPTYTIVSKTPSVPFAPAPEFTGNTPNDATVTINGQSLRLREYIESQDDSDFPDGYTNYFLFPIDSPEVEEGESPEIPESETPCPVEEGMPTPFDCYRAQLLSLGIDERLVNYIITEYIESQNLRKRLAFSCAAHSRLGSDSPLSFLSPDLLQLILSDSSLTNVRVDEESNIVDGGIFNLEDLIRILNYLNENEIPIYHRLVNNLIKLLKLGLTADEIISGLTQLEFPLLIDNEDSKFLIINIFLIIKNLSFYNDHIYDRDALEEKFYQMVNGDPG